MKKTIYTKDVKARFHETKANSKLGGKKEKILAVSYVPGCTLFYLNNGTLVSDMVGTCNGVNCKECGKRGVCYAINSFCQYDGCTLNRMENTKQLREDPEKHFQDIKNAIIKGKYTIVRYTESGELESYDQFIRLVNLARELSDVCFYLYTKNYEILRTYFKTNELPENMTILISIWGNTGVNEYQEFKNHDGIKAFVVNNPDIKVNAMCPAYRKDESGKVSRVKSDAVKCGNCKLCTRAKACKVIGCLEH